MKNVKTLFLTLSLTAIVSVSSSAQGPEETSYKIEPPTTKRIVTITPEQRTNNVIISAADAWAWYQHLTKNTPESQMLRAGLIAQIALMMPELCVSEIDADIFFSKEVLLAFSHYLVAYHGARMYLHDLDEVTWSMLFGTLFQGAIGTKRLFNAINYFMD